MENNTATASEFYFTIKDDGEAIIMVIAADGSYSQHSSEDAVQGDGDGASGPYHWRNAQMWSKCDREKAESMLQFTFDFEYQNDAREVSA